MTNVTNLPAKPFELGAGGHDDIHQGACFNELASVLAGEPFSYSPACVSPIIRRIGMRLNDRLDDDRRQLLRPFVLRSLGTAYDGRDEERRQMCNEWLLHHALPDMLDLAGKDEVAARLRSLPGDLAVEGVRRAIYEARDAAWDARRDATARLTKRIREELEKRGLPVADADAFAGAVAVADADAVAVAGAGAVADAGAFAVADAGAFAVADADAVAVAFAVADAVAVAFAVADAFAVALQKGESVYWAVRRAAQVKAEEILKPKGDELLAGAIDLLDRMLPESPLQTPVIEHAGIICGIAA